MDGGVFEGEFENGSLHGYGTFVSESVPNPTQDTVNDTSDQQSKDSYTGEWKYGMKDGQGVFTWADRSKYEGNFKEDQFDGNGDYLRSDGKHYIGMISVTQERY